MNVMTNKNEPGKVYYNTDRGDVYIVLGESYKDGRSVTLGMWSSGKFAWWWSFSVGDRTDTEL
jgi:hypothetical protein